MENHGIYISCPQQTPFEEVLNYQKAIKAKGNYDVKFWNRLSYNPNLMNECLLFAIMLPNNKWNYRISDLPSGCKKELENAINEFHELLLCYKSVNGYNIYKAQIIEDTISGIAGTSDVLNQKHIKTLETLNASGELIKKSDFQIKELDSYITHLPATNLDTRLLLLM